jgi:Protein of unknown function (DUF2865)
VAENSPFAGSNGLSSDDLELFPPSSRRQEAGTIPACGAFVYRAEFACPAGAWLRGVAVVRWHRNEPLRRRAAALFAVLAAGSLVAMPGSARTEGFFDLLFGGFHERATPPPQVNSYAEPSTPISPAPLGPENVHRGGGTGRSVAFCVRLCDGQHFPLEHMANATPVETCRAMCPASKTKVLFGSEIDHAVGRDGKRYADLDNAFVYRKQLVANCTCNGKDAFGLAPLDINSDPTLRPGDIVATKNGLMAYAGKRGKTAAFTPVDPSSLTAELSPTSSRVRLSRRMEPPPADAARGTIVPPRHGQRQNRPPVVDVRGQVDR